MKNDWVYKQKLLFKAFINAFHEPFLATRLVKLTYQFVRESGSLRLFKDLKES